MTARKRPESLDDPKPTWPPCPKCGGSVTEKITREGRPFLADLAEKLGRPSLVDEATVIVCLTCRTLAAHVERVEDVWRDAVPGVADVLVDDAIAGIRQRRFLEADDFDPMWRSM